MQIREAKDFLVRQTVEQAQMEGVALSELEKRMMYFTETGEMQEDFTQLNEDFEAEYDTGEYEDKVHGLLHRAYARVEKENPEKVRQWKEAIRELGKEDHYLLVLWGLGPSLSGVRAASLLMLAGRMCFLAVIIAGVVWGLNYLAAMIDWRPSYLYLGLFLLLYLAAMVWRDLPRRVMLAVIKFLIGRRKQEQ